MKIAIIGAGNMGGAMARLLAQTGYRVAVANPSRPKLDALDALALPTLSTTTDNAQACAGANCIILAVKPYLMQQVIEGLKPAVDFAATPVISVAAGISVEQLQQWCASVPEQASNMPIMRIMPNIALTVGQSMTFVVYSDAAKARPGLEDDVDGMLAQFGEVEEIPERLLPVATALASCGIAFALRFVRAMSFGATTLGLPKPMSREATLATLRGAVALLEVQPDQHIEELIDRVCTPGGVTAAGLQAMEAAGFSPAVYRALQAACG